MLRNLIRKYNYYKLNNLNSQAESEVKTTEEIPSSLEEIKSKIKIIFKNCDDIVLRDIKVGAKVNALIIYLDGLVKKELLDSAIIQPLLKTNIQENKENLVTEIKDNVLSISGVKIVKDLNIVVDGILNGNAMIFIEGEKKAINTDVTNFESRQVDEPSGEKVVRGPREGFTENIKTNITLIRRKIKNPNLKFEKIILGERTNTEVIICYIQGLANDDIITNVKKRLQRIKIDAILESGYIEEFIEDAPYSIFPTVGNTEKPDRVAGKLLEGRVAIICDGTPFVLTVPYIFVETLQVGEDYYARYVFSSVLRIIRIIAFFIAVLGPAIYIALISFHQDIIPFKLMLTMAASRKGVPFHPFLEAIIMTFTFELIREAGTRMPEPVGQAISIVGALVLGQAAVEAGLVSNLMIIVVAITALSSFLITPLNGTIPIVRIMFMIGANVLGLIGIFLVGKLLLIHVCMLNSFGVPYMYPFTPFVPTDMKDTFVRFPIWKNKTRPREFSKHKNSLIRMDEIDRKGS